MNKLLAASLGCLLVASINVYAADSGSSDIKQDVQGIQKEKHDIAKDNRDIRHDKNDINKDSKELNKDRADRNNLQTQENKEVKEGDLKDARSLEKKREKKIHTHATHKKPYNIMVF